MLRHERRVVFLVRGSRFETHADILSQLSPRFRELFAGSNSPYEIDERPLDFRRLLNLARGAEFGLPDPSFERFLDKYQVVLLDSLKPSEESSDRERNETCLDKVETNTFSFASPWRPIGLYFATIPQMSRETVYWPVTKPIDSARLTLSPRAKSISRYVFDMREPTSRNDHIWIVRDLRLRFRLAFKAERAPTTGTFSRANAVAHALARVALYYLTSLLDMITGEVLAVQLMLQDLANSQDFRDLDEFDVSIPFWRRASSSGATFLPIRNISEFLDVHQGLNSPFTIQNLSLLVDLELVKIPSQNAIMFYPCLQWHNCIASNFKTKFSISSSSVSSNQQYEIEFGWNHGFHRLVVCAWNRTTSQLLRLREVQLKNSTRILSRFSERDLLERMNNEEGSTTRLPVYSLRAPGPGLTFSRIDNPRVCVILRDPVPTEEVLLWAFPQTVNGGLYVENMFVSQSQPLLSS